ncbi:hypothetical protein ACYJW8_01255 [Frateuria aurantia]
MNPESVPPPSSPASRRAGRGLTWLAMWLAVLAVAGVVYLGWQQRLAQRAEARLGSSLQDRVDETGRQLDQLRSAGADIQQKLGGLSQRDQGTADQVQGMDQRVRTLESAVARISEKTLSAHDSLVLDQVESLLLTAQQRAQLFHDLSGALSAYQLAGEALTQLGNPQLDGVRTLLSQEQAELLKSQPQAQHDAEATLSDLRQAIPGLTLKPAQAPVPTGHGLWARIWFALSHVLSIQHDADQRALEQDAMLAHQLAELDAVEAQTALLADDVPAYKQALQRLSDALARQFDPAQGEVSHARASVELLLNHAANWTTPDLGGALAALRDLRRVQTVSATPEAPAPAHSVAAPAAAGSAGRQP